MQDREHDGSLAQRGARRDRVLGSRGDQAGDRIESGHRSREGRSRAALDRDRRARWGRATAAVGGAYLLNTAIKAAIGRRRPAIEGLPALMQTPTGLSFPSAHASSSFAAAYAFSPLLPAAPLYAGATAMAVSRVYLGVHYPSDIAAGALLGTVVAASLARP